MANDSLAVLSSLYDSWSSFNVTFLILYIIIVVIGLTGNSLVITIVTKTRSMYSTTNFLLANVAAADIISLVWCPIPLAVGLSRKHIAGNEADFLCKFFTGYAVTSVTVGVTFLSLVLLAVERYHAIVKPLDTRFVLRNEHIRYVIVIIWISSAVWALPGFIFSEFDDRLGRCLDPWTLEKARTMNWYLIVTLVSSVFFSSCLFYCYFQIVKGIYINKTVCSVDTAVSSDMKMKRKLALVSLTVTVAYYLCYAPFLLFEIYISFQSHQEILNNYESLYKGYRIVGFIMYVNSCLNPFFYGFQSSNYRRNFKRLFLRDTETEVNSITL